MASKNGRQDFQLNERIAAIREKNARLETRHREIELDKRRAVESGNSILPSQIRVTVSRTDIPPNRNGGYDNGNYRGKSRQNFRHRGGGNEGNLSKSLSRLHYETLGNSQSPFINNRGRGADPGAFNGRRNFGRGNSNINNNANNYVRHVEIDRFAGRGKPQRFPQPQGNRNYYGPRNGQSYMHYQQQQQQQQRVLTSAKSMPSLEQSNNRQNSRLFYNRGGNGNPNYRSQRHRHNSYKSSKSQQTPDRQVIPPPPPPFPPPSPSQPTSSIEWPKDPQNRWIRGNIIGGPSKKNSENTKVTFSQGNELTSNSSRIRRYGPNKTLNGQEICRVAAVGTQPLNVSEESDSPFINADEDELDEDGYIDDNPLDDLDQFTLKIDMDGGFIVHDAIICDPILTKPISSWIDDIINDERINSKASIQQDVNATVQSSEVNPTKLEKGVVDTDCCIFSNSSLTTSGVSTLSSLDLRLVEEDLQVTPIEKSFSVDYLDKISKIRQSGEDH